MEFLFIDVHNGSRLFDVAFENVKKTVLLNKFILERYNYEIFNCFVVCMFLINYDSIILFSLISGLTKLIKWNEETQQ